MKDVFFYHVLCEKWMSQRRFAFWILLNCSCHHLSVLATLVGRCSSRVENLPSLDRLWPQRIQQSLAVIGQFKYCNSKTNRKTHSSHHQHFLGTQLSQNEQCLCWQGIMDTAHHIYMLPGYGRLLWTMASFTNL